MDNMLNLKASLLDEVIAIADNEELMRKAINSLRRLRRTENAKTDKEVGKTVPYELSQINDMIDESEADEKAGRVISSEEMNRRMDSYISSL